MNIKGKSVWSSGIKKSLKNPALSGHKKTDVLIIGGGMAGMLTAFRLKEAGVQCLVAEAKTIGGGVTKNTTAKITAQHGFIYADLIKRYGAEQARLYYEANTKAIDGYRTLSERYPCDYEPKTAFTYSTDDKKKIEREAAAYVKLRIPVITTENIPLPVAIQGMVGMENQAQFNPLKFLYAMMNDINVYEDTFVQRIDGNKAITAHGSITAKHIVLATHYPFINIPGLFFIKLYQHRSYTLALNNAAVLDGMYVDEKKDGLSFSHTQNVLLLGGGDHRTGYKNKKGTYEYLRGIAKEAFPHAIEKHHWSTQDCMSLDGLPYAGKLSNKKDHIYVASGFNKWGMTGSMAAAGILCDLIVKGKSEYEPLYSPQRFMITKQLGINIFAAAAGLLRIGTPRCSHMGCKLKWNAVEMTWDCSCHGSRFDEKGRVLNNPAKRNIRL